MRALQFLFFSLSISWALPACADVLYENGQFCPDGCIYGWQINMGQFVSDTFTLTGSSTVKGFDIWVWEYPGDRVVSLDWSVTSGVNGGTSYGGGRAFVSQTFQYVNEYGYYMYELSATGLNLTLAGGTYWLNIQNAFSESGNSVYWDQNGGAFCHSPGCPSSGWDSEEGPIDSESFDIVGTRNSTVPEPGSILLLTSGLSVAGLLRKRTSISN